MMIMVSKAGVVAMDASSKFKYEIAPELGLRDVFKMKLEHMAKRLEINEHTPCEGLDGQCNMFCPKCCWDIS